MREIKFRVFDKKTNEMYLPIHSIYLASSTYRGTDLINELSTKNGYWGCTVNDEEAEIMQYTGLKDKNGKEIYEGDIMSFTTQKRFGFEYDGNVVVMSPVSFGSFFAKDDTLYQYTGFHIDGCSIHYKLQYGVEVIGNIHENPELLTTKNN